MNTLEDANLDNLPPEIQRTFASGSDVSFFCLPQWFGLIAACRINERRKIVNVAFDDSAPIALVYAKSTGEVLSLTNLYTCKYDIAGGDAGSDAIRNFAKEFALAMPPGSRIRLEGFDRTGTSFDGLLGGIRSAGYVAKPYFAWGTWYERTDGRGFDDFIATRASILRNTWKRKCTALERRSRTRLRVYRSGDDISTYLDAYEDVRRRSWKGAEPHPRFIPDLVRMAAKLNALRFGILDIDDVAAAAQFWIVWAGKATIFKLVYADDMSAFSPGTVLTMEMFRRVLEEDRPAEIDFGRGDDRYKEMWLSSRREHWGIEAVSPRSLKGLVGASWLALGLGRDFLQRTIKNPPRILNLRPRNVEHSAFPLPA